MAYFKWILRDTSMILVTQVLNINPLKTKRICLYRERAYRAVNTLHFGYKNQSLNVL
jgi:hypothetical protein